MHREKPEPNPQPFWPKQVGMPKLPLLYSFLGFDGPAMDVVRINITDYCDFCWRWGRVHRPPDIEQYICETCIYGIIDLLSDGADLAELRPPWQPDGRTRRANELSKIAALAKLPTDAVAKIAAFEVGQWVT